MSELEFSFSSVHLLSPFQIQLQCSPPFQIQVFQYTVLGHYLSRQCCQNVFLSSPFQNAFSSRRCSLKTDSSIFLVLFLRSVNIHMIITSLVSIHTTYRTLHFELMLFAVQNTMNGKTCGPCSTENGST
jgi:hypothetical protein